MKIENKTNLDVVNIGGDFKKFASTIAPEDMGLAFTMVSKNLYSNPIGSFIREITTNAVDANIDADENSPVLVHIYEEDGLQYIEFKDNGTGMSPEMYEKVYMSWFKSTNRETNKKHGGWGLGSKSPLAYQDTFEITTRYNGIEYYYIFSNEGTEPSSELISEESTDKSNGTTIRIEIKDGDDYKIHNACKAQLAYFKNVYVKNEKYFYDNSFNIYEHEDFYLRTGTRPYGNEMHVCLGQVAYPIDWHTIELNEVNIPVALRFGIGELSVPLNREAIAYDKRTKEILRERIIKVTDYLTKLYEEQLDIIDLFSYIKTMRDMINHRTNPPLKIADIEIDMSAAKPDVYFSPYEGVRITLEDFSSIFCFYTSYIIKSGKNYSQGTDTSPYYHLYRDTDLCYIMQRDTPNYYDSKYIGHGYLFKRGKATGRKFRAVADILCKKVLGYNAKRVRELGIGHKVHRFLKYIDDYLNENIKTYEETAPKQWIKDLKEAKKEKKEKTKGEITYYDIENHRHKIRVRELIENNKAIFLIIKDRSKKMIVHYKALYDAGNLYFKLNTKFLIVSSTVYNSLGRHKNVYDVSDIFKIGSYKNYLCRVYYSKQMHQLYAFKELFVYSDYYHTLYNKLTAYYKETIIRQFSNIPDNNGNFGTFTTDITVYFKDNIDKILKENKKSFIYVNHIKELQDLVEKAGILGYLKPNTPANIKRDFIVRNRLTKFDSFFMSHVFITNV